MRKVMNKSGAIRIVAGVCGGIMLFVTGCQSTKPTESNSSDFNMVSSEDISLDGNSSEESLVSIDSITSKNTSSGNGKTPSGTSSGNGKTPTSSAIVSSGSSSSSNTIVRAPLSEADRAIAQRLSMCVSEQDIDLKIIDKRFEEYKSIGVTSLRLHALWSQFEATEGKWTVPGTIQIFQAAARHGLSIKLVLGSIQSPPAWLLAKDGICLEDENGNKSVNTISYWHPDILDYTTGAMDKVLASLKSWGCIDSIDAIIVDLGPAGEPLYCPEWTQGTSGAQRMWCYADNAQGDFRIKMKEKYGTITAANKAWGKNYTSFDSINVPKAGEVKGTMWNDVLTWYRDTKRNFMEGQVEATIQMSQKYSNGRIKPIIYIAGGSVSEADWNKAVNDGINSDQVKMMADGDYAMDLMKKYNIWGQHTGVNDSGDVARIRKYLDNIGMYNAVIFGENSHGNHDLAVSCVETMIKNEFWGFDLVMGSNCFESDGITTNKTFNTLERAFKKLVPYINAKK